MMVGMLTPAGRGADGELRRNALTDICTRRAADGRSWAGATIDELPTEVDQRPAFEVRALAGVILNAGADMRRDDPADLVVPRAILIRAALAGI